MLYFSPSRLVRAGFFWGWKAFQERQRLQRQAKKKYLKFYGALCAQSLRQLTAGQSRRPAW